MTAVFPLLVAMSVSWTIARFEAVMFGLTGMEGNVAKVQALGHRQKGNVYGCLPAIQEAPSLKGTGRTARVG